MLKVYVDADACPVKPEIYRVAERCKLEVVLVTNSWMRIPNKKFIQLELVGDGFDEADDWIVDHVQNDDIVVTADIPLASRCLYKGAKVIGSNGKPFDEDNIAQTLAIRDLLSELRGAGEITGGPPPQTQRDNQDFCNNLIK